MNLPNAEDLFHHALALESAEARAAYLNSECAGHPTLREKVEQLLAAHEAPTGFLDTLPDEARTISGPIEETLGARIGRYKLLEKLGEGGCGVVYVAEQTEPVRRRVALKVIKLGMDTKAVVARFEAERQALAMMDHPNIAKVLDAGTTEQGRPYFVMELVRGIRITDYCDQNNLSTKDRLDLFIKVCHAIQHAHQKGIIHRDIKPSNILVTLHDGVPIPKVIDFGIAKATEGRLTDATVYTQLHQFIGTPAYMSPEQAEMSGLDIDTRSDIYSLGVLLYELLTGSTPFDGNELIASGLDGMRKTIREKEPVRPSSKLSQSLVGAGVRRLKPRSEPPPAEEESRASSRRLLQLRETVRSLRGDLDWIVMKCLEKDRTRRYETANGLAADLKRHLDYEPVIARPPNTAYRFQKAWRRNKVTFTAGMIVILALLVGILVSLWQAKVAMDARESAIIANSEKEKQRIQAVARADEAIRERQRAELQAEANRKSLYIADMHLANSAINNHNLGLAVRILDRHRPQPNQKDHRKWEWRYLWSQVQSQELFLLGTNKYNVLGMAISADGSRLATVSGWGAGDVRIWDLERNRFLSMPVENGAIGSVAFSPDQQTLAFGLQSGHIVLWDIDANRERLRFPAIHRERDIDALAFSPDSHLLFTGTTDGLLLTWDCRSNKLLEPVPIGQKKGVASILAAPDGKTLILSVYGEEMLVRWDYSSKNNFRQSNGFGGSVLALSPDGDKLSFGDVNTDNTIRVWHLADERELAVLTNHTQRVDALAFSSDGRFLASGSADHTIRLWDTETWKQIIVLKGHRNEVSSLVFSPDSKRLYSGCKDGTIRAWRVTRPKLESKTIEGPTNWKTAFVSPDGNTFCLVRSNAVASLWNLVTRTQKWEKKLRADITHVGAISGEGKWLTLGNTNGSFFLLNPQTDELREIASHSAMPFTAAAFDLRGERFILARENGFVQLWNPLKATAEWEKSTGLERTRDVYLSMGGVFAAIVNHKGELVLLNATNGAMVWHSRPHHESIRGLAIYAQERRLITASGDASIKFWDLENKTWLGEVLPAKNAFFGIDLANDETRLLANTYDGPLRLYDMETRQEVLSIELEGHPQFCSAWFVNSNNIAILYWNEHLIKFLHAPTWEEIAAAETKDLANYQAR